MRDFTEDVPRYKVLSVGKVMRPASNGLDATNAVAASTKIDAIIDRVAETDQALAVVDASGAVVGEVDRSIIMKAMNTHAD